jgi:hypothetical protein
MAFERSLLFTANPSQGNRERPALSGRPLVDRAAMMRGALLASVLRRRDTNQLVNTVFRTLAGRYPDSSERAALVAEVAAGAGFDDLVASVLETSAAAELTVDRLRPALQSQLHVDFESSSDRDLRNPPTRVVFLHIMKTGGVSLSDVCAGWSPPGRSRVHLYVDELVLATPASIARLSFIAGHIPYEALDLVPPGYWTLTMLREPVTRAVSHYLALRGSGPPYDNLTLDEFVSNEVYDVPSGNYQARQLAHRIGIADAWISYSPVQRLRATGGDRTDYPIQALFDSTPIAASDDDLLVRARRNLATIDFVGVTEDLESAADRLARLWGRPGAPVPRLNVSPPFDPRELTASIRKRLEARTAVDRVLYEEAVCGRDA